MSFLPHFEGDVFISYAHIDNQPLTEGQKGWIDNFHKILEIYLQTELGRKEITIWRDPDLRGNDDFTAEIIDQVSHAAVLVTVLSRSYLNSKWCNDEIQLFHQSAERTGGVQIANKNRIFKVVKEGIQSENCPPLLKGFDGYDFHYTDEKGRHRGLTLDVDQSKFCLKVQDVAQDISQLLETLKIANGDSDLKSTHQRVAPSGTTIYLAETTSDLRELYDNIKREMRERGHCILPDKPLPTQNASEFCDAVRRDLSCSQLSIHLIGAKYGLIPEEAEGKSIVCLQNEVAAEYGQGNSLARLLWIPEGTQLKAREQSQQRYIEYLRTDSTIQQGADLIEEPLENFKTIIQDKLYKLTASQQPSPRACNEDNLLRIYLICGKADFAAIKPLKIYLQDQGFEVIKPLKDDDEKLVSNNHRDNLATCDAVVIYYGKDADPEDDPWLQLNMAELRKISDYNRKKPMLAQAIYMGSQETEEKRAYRTREALVIRDFGQLAAGQFKEFLSQIENGKRGRS
jgi:TIR domain